LVVYVTAASVTDAKAAREVFGRAAAEGLPRLAKVLGDHVYGNEGLPEWAAANAGFRLGITVQESGEKKPGEKKFTVIKWRWVGGGADVRGVGPVLPEQPGLRKAAAGE